MKVKLLLLSLLLAITLTAGAQSKKPVYHPCFLLDSVPEKLDFIKLNAGRIFLDTFGSDCRQMLLDSIGANYIRTKDKKYLDALTNIHQNPRAKVDNLYTDMVQRFLRDDFGGFINQLYLSRGLYLPLEKEMIVALNMIVDGKPLKDRYTGLMKIEMDNAREAKDNAKLLYLQKLKTRIEEEKY